MKERQQQFIKQLLNKTFDFSSIVKDIQYIQKENFEEGFTEKSMKPVLTQLIEALETEQPNTEKFRRQLADLLSTENHNSLLERVGKGSDYYKNQLWKNLKTLLLHIEIIKTQKRTKTYLNHLLDIDQLLMKKLEEVDKASYLIDAILTSSYKFEFNPLTQKRIQERNLLITEIKKNAVHQAPPLKITKPHKRKTKKEDEKSTYHITLELLNNGITIEQIAKERNLAVGTIESHLGKLVADGAISIFKFMSESAFNEISLAINELPEGAASKELYDKLNGKYGYGYLRAVMAHKKLNH
jgi:DNA-binding NarL/FixJ family response regulator